MNLPKDAYIKKVQDIDFWYEEESISGRSWEQKIRKVTMKEITILDQLENLKNSALQFADKSV